MPVHGRWWILFRQPEALVLTRRRFSLIARVLALALLVGQLGAEAHAYSHLADATKSLPDAAQSCRACLSFAPLLCAVGSSPAALVVAHDAAGNFVPLDELTIPGSPAFRAFQPRAPPAPL